MFMPLSSDKIIDKHLTQFFERTQRIRRYLVEPYLCWPFEGSREGLTHNLIWTPWRCIVVLKVAIWSKGSRVPSYEFKEGILNLWGKGWLLMEVVKRESVRWTKSSTGFALLMYSLISSMTFLIWFISLSKCGTLREAVPLDWFSRSTFPPLSSWLWACHSAYLSWRCLLRLISLVNSWFWWVNSAMAVAMDCTCWMESGCVTGTDYQSRWGLLEASLLSWWPRLVALNLVRTM